jgi:hypothetical protein
LHNTPPHTQTHLRIQKAELRLSSDARVEGWGRHHHSARGKPAPRGHVVEIHIVKPPIIQIAAGLHRGSPSLVRDPNTIRAAFTCVELVHESRDPTDSLPQALMYTRLERVRATAGTRRGPGETVKPVFIKDRAVSLIELIADAHSGLPQDFGTKAVPFHVPLEHALCECGGT